MEEHIAQIDLNEIYFFSEFRVCISTIAGSTVRQFCQVEIEFK